MRDRVLSYIRQHQLMRPGDRLGVAVSGGSDSVALLRLLLELRAELGVVLSVVHFNHKIRGPASDADQKFVRELALGFGLEYHADSADTPAFAEHQKLSLEAAARRLRYAYFDRLVAATAVTRVATAHTRDDQAETVLMRFLRGSGTRGLSGIYPGIAGRIAAAFAPHASGPRIVRPLLNVSRAELRSYLEAAGQTWREDATNADLSFARNRVRHEILPLLRQLNPNLDQTLSETAEIARAEQEYWEQQARRLFSAVTTHAVENRDAAIVVDALAAQPLALRRRLIRLAAQHQGLPLEFRHVEEILALAASQPTRSERVLELPHGWEAVLSGRELRLRARCLTKEELAQGYECPLPVPGEARVAGRKIRAKLLPAGAEAAAAPRSRVLLDPALAERCLLVRSWRPGDRYWPEHTRSPKKLKELLQAPHIPRPQKPSWPVVVSGEEIVWVPGFAPPERFRVREGSPAALLLEQLPLEGGAGNEP